MLKAIIFDFDGIIADTEPIHLGAFKKVLNNINISLTDEDYYEKYLAYDDKTLFTEILRHSKREPDNVLIQSLIRKKNRIVTEIFNEEIALFPGFLSYLKTVKDKYLIAIGSGALKSEIVLVLKKFGIEDEIHSITAADDVVICKPNPEVFLKSLKSLNKINNSNSDILPKECLVFEDSVSGVKAAKFANMKCVAITNSYSREMLCEADIISNSFEELEMKKVEALFD